MSVTDMAKKIKWLGHDGFRIDATQTIYVDPFEIEAGPEADLILISHEHYDHCSVDDVVKIQKPETVIVTEKDSAKKLSGDIRIVKPGDAVTIGEVRIEAVPAYNTDKQFHPKANRWLGFIVQIEGVRIYHAGDTDFIPEMTDFTADIALLPVSGTYVMTADEAVDAALAIEPGLAIPMHYGAIVGGKSDAEQFQNGLAGKIEVEILEKSV